MLGTDLILTILLLLWYYDYAHFTEEKSDRERLRNLPEVIELRVPGTRIQSKKILFQNLSLNQCVIVPEIKKHRS